MEPADLQSWLDEARPDGSAVLRAAQAGDATAQMWVGHVIERRCGKPCLPVAYQWYMKAAEQGAEWAQVRVGRALLRGQGTDRNEGRALAFFSAAAGNGSPLGHYWLGRCYELGWGVDWNPTLAFQHFKTAADTGVSQAALRVAVSYMAGLGVKRDLRAAARFLKIAASDLSTAWRMSVALLLMALLIAACAFTYFGR